MDEETIKIKKVDLRRTRTWSPPFPICPTGRSLDLKINDHSKIDLELFSRLEYLSEIQEMGLLRIAQINPVNSTEENWLSFRAFIRQAKLYYFSAKEQSSSISSLNFFYSFLNLVKAYCSLHSPEKISGHIKHGLSLGGSFSDVFEQDISLHPDGVMSIFYELVTNIKIDKKSTFPVQSLLSYCSDISFEYGHSVPNPEVKISLAKLAVTGESEYKTRTLLAMSNFEYILKNELLNQSVQKNFEQIDLSTQQASDIFQIKLNEFKVYSFLQSKEEDLPFMSTVGISKGCYEIFSPFVSFYLIRCSDCSKINLPLKNTEGVDVILNEYLAIYGFMFYVSELVRYNPKVIQDNLSKPQGWLMERFIINTPQTFLRYMVNLISGDDFLFYT